MSCFLFEFTYLVLEGSGDNRLIFILYLFKQIYTHGQKSFSKYCAPTILSKFKNYNSFCYIWEVSLQKDVQFRTSMEPFDRELPRNYVSDYKVGKRALKNISKLLATLLEFDILIFLQIYIFIYYCDMNNLYLKQIKWTHPTLAYKSL